MIATAVVLGVVTVTGGTGWNGAGFYPGGMMSRAGPASGNAISIDAP